jgi:hypothetical protein
MHKDAYEHQICWLIEHAAERGAWSRRNPLVFRPGQGLYSLF